MYPAYNLVSTQFLHALEHGILCGICTSARNEYMRPTVWVLFAWNLQQSREGRCILVHRWSYSFRNLISAHPWSAHMMRRRQQVTRTHMLVDQQDGDVLPLCELLEGGLDSARLRLCWISGRSLPSPLKVGPAIEGPSPDERSLDSLESTIKKFLPCLPSMCPIPASNMPVTES